ncbi:hypothetical protein [Luteolibacter flavescens]|uniref:hypothetical protein n=1 Tax=Luteolibacter flavescens TaxID=1859460 RepID=UPI002222CEE9|nr:hypothetical protein [Luteolibacter flavescens]
MPGDFFAGVEEFQPRMNGMNADERQGWDGGRVMDAFGGRLHFELQPFRRFQQKDRTAKNAKLREI